MIDSIKDSTFISVLFFLNLVILHSLGNVDRTNSKLFYLSKAVVCVILWIGLYSFVAADIYRMFMVEEKEVIEYKGRLFYIICNYLYYGSIMLYAVFAIIYGVAACKNSIKNERSTFSLFVNLQSLIFILLAFILCLVPLTSNPTQ